MSVNLQISEFIAGYHSISVGYRQHSRIYCWHFTLQKPLNIYEKPDLKPCIYCDSKHCHNNCDRVKIIKQRKMKLNQQKRCFNCLRSGCTKYQCHSRGRCLNCRLKHHTSICEPHQPSQDSNKKPTEKQENSTQNSKDIWPTSTTLATMATTHKCATANCLHYSKQLYNMTSSTHPHRHRITENIYYTRLEK